MTFQHSTAIVPFTAAWPAMFVADLDRAAGFAKAPATRRAYRSDFAIFEAWCAVRGLNALPATAEAVAAFLACEADRGMSASTTCGRRRVPFRQPNLTRVLVGINKAGAKPGRVEVEPDGKITVFFDEKPSETEPDR